MSTNIGVLNNAASQGGSYQQYLQRLAQTGGLEGREAQALLAGNMSNPLGQLANTGANFVGNTLGQAGMVSMFNPNANEYGQVAGGYGPQGLSNLHNIYYGAWNAGRGNTVDSTGGVQYGGGAASQAAAQQSALYDTYANQANDALARALRAYNDSRANVSGQFDTRMNELGSQRKQTEANVASQRMQNQQNLLSNRNQIRDSASQGLRSLLSTLGARGAGGSSAAMYLAPEAVQNVASAQRAGANTTFAENEQGIDTNWNNFVNNWENEKRKLEGWRNDNLSQTQADYDRTSGDLSRILEGIRGRVQPADAFGGQISSIAGAIPNTFRADRTYTGNTPVYTPANLSSYQAAIGPNAEVANAGPAGDSNVPWLNNILNRERERRNRSII